MPFSKKTFQLFSLPFFKRKVSPSRWIIINNARKKIFDLEIQSQSEFRGKFFTRISVKSKVQNSSMTATDKLFFPPCTFDEMSKCTRSVLRFSFPFLISSLFNDPKLEQGSSREVKNRDISRPICPVGFFSGLLGRLRTMIPFYL